MLKFPDGIKINGLGRDGEKFNVEPGPTTNISWSLNQARSIMTNLTASGPSLNPQGSYHYGQINVTRIIRLPKSTSLVDRKHRYAVNGVSFIPIDMLLKLVDYYNMKGVFKVGSVPDKPKGRHIHLDTTVMEEDYRKFVEIVSENRENIVQRWHIDGYSFFIVG
ncbi:hypothetical protein HAX54_005462 [Datura stramonium]|uniref:Plastocyanin-like domain-containing protein n=1 Tax=Datura stramonium TaxID=4076 RepID=A0ABS8T9Z9_DATST|nr:hypothetical protein [Datura stramonium]